MKRLAILVLVAAPSRVALAQPTTISMDPSAAVDPAAQSVSGTGIRVGESSILHPQIGIETGVISNVFFEESNPTSAGMLKVLFEVGVGNALGKRGAKPEDAEVEQELGDLQYDANLYLQYEQYLSNNDNVTSVSGLGAGLIARAVVRPGMPISFHVAEQFNRLIRPTNFESSINTNRDINTIGLMLKWSPRGRSLSGNLHYSNTIDFFEEKDQRFANRFQNTIGVRADWKALPLTLLYVDVSQGIFTGLGDESTKVSSYPFSVVAGTQTAITVATSISALLGYRNGFYSEGANYSAVVAGLQGGWRFSDLGKATVTYSYDHSDSINANFFRDHMFQIAMQYQLQRFAIFSSAEARLRRYQGITLPVMGESVRDDVILAASVGLRYSLKDWLAASLDYTFISDQTDYRYDVGDGAMDDPSFVRHAVMLGVRAAY